MKPCRKCGIPTNPRGHKDFICNDCFRLYKRELRQRHAAAGRPVKTGRKVTADLGYFIEYYP